MTQFVQKSVILAAKFGKAAGLAVGLLLASLSSVQAADVTLRLHQFLPLNSHMPSAGLQPWMEAIEEQSGDRIKFEHYPSMTLGGSPAQLFDQAREGVVDVIWTVLGYTPGRFPKTEVFELPFMVTTGEVTSVALQSYVEQHAMDEFDDVHLIAVHTHGPGLFHTKETLATLDDLSGMKIRGGSRIINDMLQTLGATPIGMPVPQVAESLSRGVLDGATLPWEVTSSLRTSEIVSNHTQFSGDRGLYTLTFAIVMNKDSYNALSDDLKLVIDDNSGAAIARAMGQAADGGDINGLKIAQESNNSILTLDEAETLRWKTAAQATIDSWIENTPEGQMLFDAAVLEMSKAME